MLKLNKLEKELDAEKGKLKALETNSVEGERFYKSKINTLEGNLEQLSSMYHKQTIQESRHRLDSQLVEKKLQRKTERIVGLEKQLYDAK